MATPYATRLALWKAHLAGADAPSLARRFGLSGRTVRHLLAPSRDQGGPSPPRLPRPNRPGFPR